jgi:hypothetical protein
MSCLTQLNTDVLNTIVCFLDVSALARVTAVCSLLHHLCEAPRVWADLCAHLWADKILDSYVDNANAELSWKQRYRDSLVDSVRQQITEEELCRLVWRFRFKGASLRETGCVSQSPTSHADFVMGICQ